MKKLIKEMIAKEISKQLKIQRILKETQLLSETSLKRVMTKYFEIGFIVISADRTCEAELQKPKGVKCTPEETAPFSDTNNKNEQQLKKDIRSAGFGFVPSYGGFREEIGTDKEGEPIYGGDFPHPEMSFIVPMQKAGSYKVVSGDGEELKKLGVGLSRKYNQDSFFYKPPNSVDSSAYFIDKSGEIDMKFDNFTTNDMEQIYYTELRKKGPTKTRQKKLPSYGRFSAIPENRQFVLHIPKPPNSVAEARKRYGEYFFRIKK